MDMSGVCARCKDVVESRHHRNHTKLCDACYIDTRIRLRVAEQTSYNGHLSDIELLLDKHDCLINELDVISDKLINLEPGTVTKLMRRIKKIVSTHRKLDL